MCGAEGKERCDIVVVRLEEGGREGGRAEAGLGTFNLPPVRVRGVRIKPACENHIHTDTKKETPS